MVMARVRHPKPVPVPVRSPNPTLHELTVERVVGGQPWVALVAAAHGLTTGDGRPTLDLRGYGCGFSRRMPEDHGQCMGVPGIARVQVTEELLAWQLEGTACACAQQRQRRRESRSTGKSEGKDVGESESEGVVERSI